MTTTKISTATAIIQGFTDISNTNESIKKDANNNDSTGHEPITAARFTKKLVPAEHIQLLKTPLSKIALKPNIKNNSRDDNLPNITTHFADRSVSGDNIFVNQASHRLDTIEQTAELSNENDEDNFSIVKEEQNMTQFFEVPTVGPYDSSIQDYQADEGETTFSQHLTGDNNADDDARTVIPEAESSYKYNIKVRNNGKVLGPVP